MSPAADDRSLSRVDVAGRLIRDVLDDLTTAQETACRGNLDVARDRLRSALRKTSTVEALTQGILDDLTTFEQAAQRIAQ